MTEARKEIINLISYYMDKTLSEGCYLLKDNIFYKIIEHNIFYFDNGTYEDSFYTSTSCITEPEHYQEGLKKVDLVVPGIIEDRFKHNIKEDNTIKIIGHYDITAIFNYVYFQGLRILFDIIGDVFHILNFEGKPIGSIPNKPVNLYTEQEDIEVRDILLKIKIINF